MECPRETRTPALASCAVKPAGTRSGAKVTSVTPGARRHQHLGVVRVGQADHRGIVHARLLGRQERPFEVNAENARIDGGGAMHGIERGAHLGGRIADQRRQERRRSELSVCCNDRGDALGRRLVVEQHIAAAIHLDVDEPGASHAPSGKVRIGIAAGNSRLRSDARMQAPSITTAQSWCKAAPSKTVPASTACRSDPLIWCA